MADIRLRANADMAGMLPDGISFGRRIEGTDWLVPCKNVRVVDGGERGPCVEWGYADPKVPLEVANVMLANGARVLDSFIQITDDAPGKVSRFIRKFGPFPICVHSKLLCPCGSLMNPQPVAMYRSLAAEAQAILAVAASEHRGEKPARTDMAILESLDSLGGVDYPLRGPREVVGVHLSKWLELGRVRPWVFWCEKGHPELQISVMDAFAGIALQLALAVARIDKLANCSECGQLFIPKRRRAESREMFCPDCGKTAANRRAQERRRKKLRGDTGP